MTMIVISTHTDHAEIMTDTASYDRNVYSLGRCSKVVSIPHLSAAVVTGGDALFGTDAKGLALQAAEKVATFDDLIDTMTPGLRQLWASRLGEWEHASPGMVLLVGYSNRAGRFITVRYAADEADLTPTHLGPVWMTPPPWSCRPDPLEQSRHLAWDAQAAAADPDPDTDEDYPSGAEVVAAWSQRPEPVAPENLDEWVDLALQIRAERALSGYAKVIVAGDVHMTVLRSDATTTYKLFEFNDEGEEFLALVAGTQHPVAQVMACPCGSGQRFLNCHLAAALDQPCGCRQHARTFRECCALTPDQVDELPLVADPRRGQQLTVAALSS